MAEGEKIFMKYIVPLSYLFELRFSGLDSYDSYGNWAIFLFFFQLYSLLVGPYFVFFDKISYPFPQNIETAVGLLVVLICLEISLSYL